MGHKTKARILRSQLAFGKKWGANDKWLKNTRKNIIKEDMLAQKNMESILSKQAKKTSKVTKTKVVSPAKSKLSRARRPQRPSLPRARRGYYLIRGRKMSWHPYD